MKKICNKKILSLILGVMLIVAMAFSMTACGGNYPDGEVPSGTGGAEGSGEEKIVVGTGKIVFIFQVQHRDGSRKTFEVHTDKTMVGEALEELNLITGEEGQFGIYVKSVDGETLDFNKDGKYWAFYVNGQYGMSGADTTEIKEGEIYLFKAE